jgi:beta-mannanase
VNWTPGATLAQIVGGQFDDCFRDVAQRLKGFAHPVFLRTMWEFNGTWFPWSYGGDASRFVAAWRHVVDVFRAQGVTNVSFVWAPGEGHGCLRDCYPGDGYVDWVASDGYNWNRSDAWCGALDHPHPGWCELEEIFHDITGDNVEQMWGPRKPYMVAETGTVEDAATAGRKREWFLHARDAIKARFPYLRALVYFDQDVSASEGANWRIDTSSSAIDGFHTLAQDTYFRTAG